MIAFQGRAAHHKALMLTSILCVLLAFGPVGVLFEFVPLNQTLLPERFINVSAVLIPLMIATTAHLQRKRGWLGLSLIDFTLVLLLEFVPAWRVVHMRDAPLDETAIASALAEGKSGRGASFR